MQQGKNRKKAAEARRKLFMRQAGQSAAEAVRTGQRNPGIIAAQNQPAPAPAAPPQGLPQGPGGPVQHGRHSMPLGTQPAAPQGHTPARARPMETLPGTIHPVTQAQIQPHQVVRRGEFSAQPGAPMGSAAYAPHSGQQVPVTVHSAPLPPTPAQPPLPQAVQGDVTVILYSSGSSANMLGQQVEALRRQTVHAAQLWVHVDGPSGHDENTLSRMTCHRTQVHFGRYHRISLARNVNTRFVALLDEDTIPGRRWLERTLGALEEVDSSPDDPMPFGGAVMAGAGSLLASDDPSDVRIVGPEFPTDEPISVDFGRQSWVFTPAVARIADSLPRVGASAIAFGFAMSAAAAIVGLPTVVLDYGRDHDDWLSMGETTIVSPGEDVYAAYGNYRQVGWTPSFVAAGSGGSDAAPEGAIDVAAEPAGGAPPQVPLQAPPQGSPQAIDAGPPGGQNGEYPEGAVVQHQNPGPNAVTTVETVLRPEEATPPPAHAATEHIVAPSPPPKSSQTERVIGQVQEGTPKP